MSVYDVDSEKVIASVGCDYCGAEIGAPCVYTSVAQASGAPMGVLHYARYERYEAFTAHDIAESAGHDLT